MGVKRSESLYLQMIMFKEVFTIMTNSQVIISNSTYLKQDLWLNLNLNEILIFGKFNIRIFYCFGSCSLLFFNSCVLRVELFLFRTHVVCLFGGFQGCKINLYLSLHTIRFLLLVCICPSKNGIYLWRDLCFICRVFYKERDFKDDLKTSDIVSLSSRPFLTSFKYLNSQINWHSHIRY